MEEKRIFLQPDDEITDVISKIKAVDKEIAVLIIPKSAIVLQSIVNLKLIKRKADELNKRLAVVTDSKRARTMAEKVGLNVYKKAKVDKISQSEEKKQIANEVQERFPLAIDRTKADPKSAKQIAPPKAPKKVPSASPKKRKLIFGIIGVVVLVGLACAYYFLPQTTVRLKLATKEEDKKIEVEMIDSKEIESKQIEGKVIEAVVKTSDKFDATGEKTVGGRASAEITVYNYWSSEAQTLVETTRFIHNASGKVFRSTSSISVPGTTVVSGQTVPGTATVTVQADGIGDSFNVSSSQLTIPGLSTTKQEKIYGQSDSGITGGYQKEILVVSQSDYNSAKKKLLEELDSELEEQWAEQVTGKEVLDRQEEEIVEEKAAPKVGQEAGSFTLSVKKKVTAMAYQKEDYNRVIKDKFDRKLSDEKELLVDESTGDLVAEIKILNTDLDFDDGEAKLNLLVKGQTVAKLDQGILKDNLIKQSEVEAEKYLIGFSQIQDADVELWPFWVRSVPNRVSRITFDTSYDD